MMKHIVFVAALTATPALAEVYHAEGVWQVVIDLSDPADTYCGALTFSDSTMLSLIGTPGTVKTGQIAAVVVDEAWSLGQREIRGFADVDNTRFELVAIASGNSLVVNALTPAFITALQGGRTLTLTNAEAKPVVSFSLEGSRGALVKLAECITRLPASPADPFAASGPTF